MAQAHRREPDLTDDHWRGHPTSPIRCFDHVGITVRDLDTVTAFFVGLGLEIEGRTVLEGDFLDNVIGMPHPITTRGAEAE